MLDLTDRHVFITGGSAGLGLAMAKSAARRGAHVVICARREPVLRAAVAQIKASLPVTSSDGAVSQTITYVTADCTIPSSIAQALDMATHLVGGRPPYMVVCNAGTALPKTFLDHAPEDFEFVMKMNYLTAAYTAHAALKRMVDAVKVQEVDEEGNEQRRVAQGKIVFVSSMASMVTFTGYSAYSPSKAAVNLLARALRHEVLGGAAAGISIHTFFPGSIDTDSFAEEQRIKPAATKELEKDDEVLSPEACCEHLFNGLDKGYEEMATNFNGEMLRAGSKGQTAGNGVLDGFLAMCAWFGMIIWRMTELMPVANKMPAIPFAAKKSQE